MRKKNPRPAAVAFCAVETFFTGSPKPMHYHLLSYPRLVGKMVRPHIYGDVWRPRHRCALWCMPVLVSPCYELQAAPLQIRPSNASWHPTRIEKIGRRVTARTSIDHLSFPQILLFHVVFPSFLLDQVRYGTTWHGKRKPRHDSLQQSGRSDSSSCGPLEVYILPSPRPAHFFQPALFTSIRLLAPRTQRIPRLPERTYMPFGALLVSTNLMFFAGRMNGCIWPGGNLSSTSSIDCFSLGAPGIATASSGRGATSCQRVLQRPLVAPHLPLQQQQKLLRRK